jgi:hypothetical protein
MKRSEVFCTTLHTTFNHHQTNLRNVHFKPTHHPAMIINIMLWVVRLLGRQLDARQIPFSINLGELILDSIALFPPRY